MKSIITNNMEGRNPELQAKLAELEHELEVSCALSRQDCGARRGHLLHQRGPNIAIKMDL